jgi:hypothetical protein
MMEELFCEIGEWYYLYISLNRGIERSSKEGRVLMK